IDDVSVGEFAQIAMCAQLYGVKPILAAGDQALVDEASALFPDIHAVAVKRGLDAETGADVRSPGEYGRSNVHAEHLTPEAAVTRRVVTGLQVLVLLLLHSVTRCQDAPDPVPRRSRLALRQHRSASQVVINAEYPDPLTLLNVHIE